MRPAHKGCVIKLTLSFETARIKVLSARFPRLKKPLLAINE